MKKSSKSLVLLFSLLSTHSRSHSAHLLIGDAVAPPELASMIALTHTHSPSLFPVSSSSICGNRFTPSLLAPCALTALFSPPAVCCRECDFHSSADRHKKHSLINNDKQWPLVSIVFSFSSSTVSDSISPSSGQLMILWKSHFAFSVLPLSSSHVFLLCKTRTKFTRRN